jgi:hypothetical protein
MRTGTIKIVTSLRYLLSITVRIVSVITTMRSAVLSCSHETFCIDGEISSLSNESPSDTFIVGRYRAAFSAQRQLSRAGTLAGVVRISNSFWWNAPQNSASLSPVTASQA